MINPNYDGSEENPIEQDEEDELEKELKERQAHVRARAPPPSSCVA